MQGQGSESLKPAIGIPSSSITSILACSESAHLVVGSHPHSETVSPTLSARSCPHVCERRDDEMHRRAMRAPDVTAWCSREPKPSSMAANN